MASTALILATSSLFLTMITISSGAPVSPDIANLLKFRDSINDTTGILSNWSLLISPCFNERNNWIGIVCSEAGSIWGLKLDNMGLSGSINTEILAQLSKLRSVSFMNNSFDGVMPDFRRLTYLQLLYLSNNRFEGMIDPDAFDGMKRLRKIHLSNNRFGGQIPKSVSQLENLEELRLEGNQFQGVIPDVKSDVMQIFNVSGNQLNGHIPSSLAKFDTSAFQGNKQLCGQPLNTTCAEPSNNKNTASSSTTPPQPPPPQPPPPPPPSEKPIPLVAILSGVFVILVLAILIFLIIRNNAATDTWKRPDKSSPSRMPTFDSAPHKRPPKTSVQNQKMTFLHEDMTAKFDLADLLKAGAEIMGSGCFGSSYKATLSNGTVVVVKRFKQMNNVSREKFDDHMRKLGLLSHPNLLPLVAYYYRKEEKLFISEAYHKGSLGNLLHGQQMKGKTTLDWATRLKIIKGVSQGLLELYTQFPSLITPHGHLKSSNVLLTKTFDPVLTDYALLPLLNQESAESLMVAYKSPEYYNHNQITKKTDVWALGILILEVVTGKFPAGFQQQGKEVDMTGWVEGVGHGGIDKSISQTSKGGCEGEMQRLLSVAMACCEASVEKRLDIEDACVQIGEVRERDGGDDDYFSTRASTEVDFRSVRGASADEITVVID